MIHVVDAAGTEGRDPVDDIYKINNELKAYNADIANRPQVIAANKIDAIFTEDDPVQRLKDEFEPQGVKVFPISGVTGQGIKELLYYVSNELQHLDQETIVFEHVRGRRAEDRKDAGIYKSGFRERICIFPEIPQGFRNSGAA